MTFTTKSVTVISIFIFFLLSIEAQLALSTYVTWDLTDTASYISLSPEYSPASAPSPGGNEFDIGEGLFPDIPLPDVSIELPAQGVTKPSFENQAQVAQMVEKSMQLVEQKIIEFNVILKKRLEDPETSATTQECINQCDQVYGAAVDDIKNSIQALANKDLIKANFDINAISINVDTCQRCFSEMIGEDPELEKFDQWVRGITGQALGSLEGVSS